MRNVIRILPAIALVAACGRSPEMQVLSSAMDAMGGRDRIQAVQTLVLEGEGTSPNLGQNVTPDGQLPVWKVTEFKRTIDLANGRMRERQLRTAQFLFALATVQRQDGGLDGDVAYDIGPDGTPRRAAASLARERHIDVLHHPLTVLRAAVDADARVTNLRQQGNEELLDLTTATGDALTLAVDATTKLPTRVTSLVDNPNLGDVELATAFSDWEEISGLKLPKHLTTTIDKYPQFDLQISKNTVDGEAVNLVASQAVKSTPPPAAPPITVTAQQVADGIWWLAGSGNHRSIVFEFDDHLTLFEVPLNEARSEAVIAKARTLRPGKPLTQAIVSHHHFDHSAGLRAAVAEGLTIITYRGNVDFFQDLVARKHTLVPDALAKHPQPLKVIPVDDELTLKDASLEVRLYHLMGNPREGTNLFAWVPREGILVQADLYDSTWTQYPWADNVVANLKTRNLPVALDVPVHGAIQPWPEVLQTMQSKKSGANP